jgi:hypothetical protein
MNVAILCLLGVATSRGETREYFRGPHASTDTIRVTLIGTVYDSIGRKILGGARVRIAANGDSAGGTRLSALTNAAGDYRIEGVPLGHYDVTFAHGALDSLGMVSAPRSIDITAAAGSASQRVDLATPSARTLLRAVCPQPAAPNAQDSTVLIFGHARGAGSENPLAGATISASWAEWTTVSADLGTWHPRERHAFAETTEDGWFALCGVPGDIPLLLQAEHGPDSSGYVRMTIPSGNLRHLTWHVGESTRREAQLKGNVRDSAGRPVANAHATLWGTDADRITNARGLFSLDSLPGGTQTLEVRAIGFVPVTAVVHLTEAHPVEVSVTLGERVTELPKVAVRAKEMRGIRLDEFYGRMRDSERGINHGYFITPEDLERRKPPLVTNIFDGIPGISVERDPFNPRSALVRGPLPEGLGSTSRCQMAVFVDGMQIIGGPRGNATMRPRAPGTGMSADPLDKVVSASEVAAIEVYPRPVMAPPRYQPLNGTCGVILIWSK